MDAYTSETQQIEEIKKWWRENGLSIVLSLTLGVSGIFGWRYWQSEKVENAEVASALYSDMIASLQNENGAGARETADKILAEYKNTTYGVFALMSLAGLAVDDDDLATAETHLRRALEQTGDESLSHVIRIRLIRILISRNELDQANALSKRQEQGAFAAVYDELSGDISSRLGNTEAARAAYQQATNKLRAGGHDVSTLELKLNNIGQASHPARQSGLDPESSQNKPSL